MIETNKIHQGNAFDVLSKWPNAFVDTCVTSPPYWGLRDYGVTGQLGLERNPDMYVQRLLMVFRQVRRVLKDEGTLWLNLGDTYANPSQSGGSGPIQRNRRKESGQPCLGVPDGFKAKDLCMIPARVAIALQEDGWYLRSDIIWHKPNPMPESVTDRPTKSHEYIFLLSKSPHYYYDAEAIKEPIRDASIKRLAQNVDDQQGSGRVPGKTNGRMKAVAKIKRGSDDHSSFSFVGAMVNKKSVWTVATMPFKEAHFATFPENLIKPCILAGAPPRGLVLDPFMGAGTTALVASSLNRQFIGVELNKKYIEIANKRIASEVAQEKFA